MGQPDRIIQGVETLTGGTADRFLIAAGAGGFTVRIAGELVTDPR
jgi:hypothetical protein